MARFLAVYRLWLGGLVRISRTREQLRLVGLAEARARRRRGAEVSLWLALSGQGRGHSRLGGEGARQGVRAGRCTGIGRFDGRVDLVRSCSRVCFVVLVEVEDPDLDQHCGIQRGYEHCNVAREVSGSRGENTLARRQGRAAWKRKYVPLARSTGTSGAGQVRPHREPELRLVCTRSRTCSRASRRSRLAGRGS